jgi:hypothetical protein
VVQISRTSSRNDETQKVQVRGTVEVGTIPFGHLGRREWRPTEILATFERHRVNGGDWTDWEVEHLSWSGHTVRQDGTAGIPRSDRLYLSELTQIGGKAGTVDLALAHVREWLSGVMPAGDMPAPVSAHPVRM